MSKRAICPLTVAFAFVCIAILAPPPAGGDDAPAKATVPDDASLKTAQRKVKATFKKEYADRNKRARHKLAMKLSNTAKQTSDDAAVRYFMWHDAHRLFAQVGDFAAAFECITELDSYYQIDSLAMKLAALTDHHRAVKERGSARQFAELALPLIDVLMAEARYELLLPLAKLAFKTAVQSEDGKLQLLARNKKQRVKQIDDEYRNVIGDIRRLARTAEHPVANLRVGRFECFWANRWQSGLRKLVAGNDGQLSGIAKAELASPTTTPARVELAEAWFDLAGHKKYEKLSKSMFHRAAHWFDLAAAGLEGLNKAEVEKRLDETYRQMGLPPGIRLLDAEHRKLLVPYDNGNKNKYFLFVDKVMNWRAASQWCSARGATLACVANRNESDFLGNLSNELQPKATSIWLGGSDVAKEGQWRWEDGSRFVFNRWGSGQPDNYNQQHHIYQYKRRSAFVWDDGNGGWHKTFVAQWIVP